MKVAVAERRTPASDEMRLLPSDASYASITAAVSAPLLDRSPGQRWWIAVTAAGALTLLLFISIGVLFAAGVGIWGVNTSVIWGFAIANYVWWLGIGHAGTLISSLLLITRQSWRASINRFAEATTLFAASIAGLFPILHLGRPYLFYWLFPYPSTMTVWPQWRSPLVWDFFAIASYILFSLLFWYIGLIPDAAALRDRAKKRSTQRFYGILALGWRGSARHWSHYEAVYWTMAAVAVPLVVSVHTIVGLDFAASLMPGWAETLFPPYFVVGALYSGFGMVVILAALLRRGLQLEELITARHFDAMGKFLLMGAIVIGLCYATEWFFAWYSGKPEEWRLVAFEFTGAYAPFYYLLLALNVVIPQVLWWERARTHPPWIVTVAILLNVGMWLERVLIIIMSLSHSFVPSEWSLFVPTLWDWAFLLGSIGFFALLFLFFVRLFPVIAMHDVRRLIHLRGAGA
jgi:molybdopterin-containing oxidoreductase family membrane subunit